MSRSNFRAYAYFCLPAVVLIFASVSWSQNRDSAGLPNFGTVSSTLFRGAQPSTSGLTSLKQMGVAIVVNFREEPDEMASEKRAVESLGMKYVSIPWSGHDNPSNTQIVQFLDLVRGNPQSKIFVHCQAGADRTGTMVAAYRIAMEHKSTAEAMKEMHSFHYHHFFLPQLERYVNDFPHLLAADTIFSAYAPAAMTATTTAAASAVGSGVPAANAPLFTPALSASAAR